MQSRSLLEAYGPFGVDQTVRVHEELASEVWEEQGSVLDQKPNPACDCARIGPGRGLIDRRMSLGTKTMSFSTMRLSGYTQRRARGSQSAGSGVMMQVRMHHCIRHARSKTYDTPRQSDVASIHAPCIHHPKISRIWRRSGVSHYRSWCQL
jgi:hypothetical protein